MDLESTMNNESSEKEQSESSESEEKSVNLQKQEITEISDDTDQKAKQARENGDQIQNENDGKKDEESPESEVVKKRSYECKYCTFTTENLTGFKDHVDSNHPNVILNPLYLCAVCNFKTKKFDSLTEHNKSQHPGKTNFKFKRITVDNQTVLQQTIEGKDKSENCDSTMDSETSPMSTCISTSVTSPESLLCGNEMNGHLDEITAVNINGTVIIPEPSMFQGYSHVSPMLQRPPNFSSVPKIAVPLNTTKYNPLLDDNMTLITSFNKFPYPTHAELSWLTAASKHPEEQIKVWFTTQRLKQGITWSPEEVEEARKKMFNGSIPPAHNIFPILPTSPVSRAVVHTTTVESSRNGLNHATGSKRSLTTTTFGPESKRPIMAVAPNPGDKGLMAPPPPPPLQKQGMDAKRAEIKRNGVPLLSPQSSLAMKTKLIPAPNSKTKPVVSLPSIVFPESLTRPMIAPPPFYTSPFKNNILVPLKTPEKLSVSLPDGAPPNSVPVIPPHIRRPPIIQAIRSPGKPQMQGVSALNGSQIKEQQQGAEGKGSYNRVEANGKWMHDQNLQNNGIVHLDGNDPKTNFQQKGSVLTQFPLLERMKGKTAEQLKILEENFLRNSFPTHCDVDNLAASTRLSHQEIESWFNERRALRDNLEQALLNSMGTKRTGPSFQNVVDKRLQNGIHKISDHLKANLPFAGSGNSVPEDFAQTRWPFAEELSQRWFSGNVEHNGVNGKTGSALLNSDPIGQRCQDSTNGGKALEVELGWFMEQRNKSLSEQQNERLQEHYNRLRQTSLEMKNGGLFGFWMDERRQDRVLDRDRALSEDSTGRLSG